MLGLSRALLSCIGQTLAWLLLNESLDCLSFLRQELAQLRYFKATTSARGRVHVKSRRVAEAILVRHQVTCCIQSFERKYSTIASICNIASSGARPRVIPEHDLHDTRTFQKGRRAGHAKPGHAGPWRQPAKTTFIYPRAEADLVHMGLHTRRTCWRDRNRLPRGGAKPPLPLLGEDPGVSRGCRAVRIIAAVTQGSGRSEGLRGHAGQTGELRHGTRYWAQYTDCHGLPRPCGPVVFPTTRFLPGSASRWAYQAMPRCQSPAQLIQLHRIEQIVVPRLELELPGPQATLKTAWVLHGEPSCLQVANSW